ncbi:MAG TPA: COX15/CtaA family protein [Anaerolineae bacterium]|nr:COX15/CtaA family protein [Anaerolineae bacterium]
MNNKQNLARYSWAILAYTIIVILWGAFVRATGSGAGCGRHWPTCNGDIIPRPESIETLIEFSHRLSSSFLGLLAIALLVWVWRLYPPQHRTRRAAALSFFLILVEGLIGAALVRLELVADNDSSARAIVMGLHLINTLILTACLTITSWWLSGKPPLRWRPLTPAHYLMGIALGAMLILSAFGAITALGDTLFPHATIADDFNPASHFTVRFRIWHPLIAIATTVYIISISRAILLPTATPDQTKLIYITSTLLIIQLLAGVINIVLRAPVWLQLLHLLLANAIWISLVLLTAHLIAAHPPDQQIKLSHSMNGYKTHKPNQVIIKE